MCYLPIRNCMYPKYMIHVQHNFELLKQLVVSISQSVLEDLAMVTTTVYII